MFLRFQSKGIYAFPLCNRRWRSHNNPVKHLHWIIREYWRGQYGKYDVWQLVTRNASFSSQMQHLGLRPLTWGSRAWRLSFIRTSLSVLSSLPTSSLYRSLQTITVWQFLSAVALAASMEPRYAHPSLIIYHCISPHDAILTKSTDPIATIVWLFRPLLSFVWGSSRHANRTYSNYYNRTICLSLRITRF